VTLTPTLVWNASSGANYYVLEVATDSVFSSLVSVDTVTSTSDGVGILVNGTEYWWRVIAWNGAGSSPWSSVWSFVTVSSGSGLAAPVLVSPFDGSTGVSVSPTLAWNASAGATSYQAQVATDSSFVSLVYNDTSGSASTSRVVSSLANSTTYYWRVRARNAMGSSAWSSVWSFTTGPSSFVRHYPAEMPKNVRKPVTVYNLLGRVVSRSRPLEYRAMTSGCYIYKTGDRTKKNASLR
jgi:hypothetical protein